VTSPADVLGEAERWIGAHETPDGSNVVPGITDFWPMVGAWCACFVSACFWRVGLPLGPYDNGHSGGFLWCSDGAQWFERAQGNAAGTTDAAGAKIGDVVFFEWGSTSGGLDHVGLVVENTGYGLVTIEGNVGNRVDVFTRAYWEVPVVGRPRWNEQTGDDEMGSYVPKQIAWTHAGSEWARRVLGPDQWDSAALMLYESGIVTYIEDPASVDWFRRMGVPDIGRIDDHVFETYTYAAERIT
jgi:hypothetical protein